VNTAPYTPVNPVRARSLPDLSAKGILAPVADPISAELSRLDRMPSAPTVVLRRAYVQLELGLASQAIRELNRTMFGDPPPTDAVMAWCRYIRSMAYERRGDEQRRAHDLAEAAKLAPRGDLSRLIAAAKNPKPAPARTAPAKAWSSFDRSAWGATSAKRSRMVPMHGITKITIHHSAVLARNDSMSRTRAVLRSIQNGHMRGRGWGDIGYHYLIDRQGRIWEGRRLAWQGAHAGNPTSNRGNIGICLLGNFTGTGDGQHPSSAQLEAMEYLVIDLATRHNVPVSRVLTHREIRATDCPGANLQLAVNRLRQTMASRIARQGGRRGGSAAGS